MIHFQQKHFIYFLAITSMIGFMSLLSGCKTIESNKSSRLKPDSAATFTDKDIASRFNLTLAQVDRLHRMRGLSNLEIATLSPKAFKKALKKIEKPKPAYPKESVKWRHGSLVNENGVIPHNALLKARDHVKNMPPPKTMEIWGSPAGQKNKAVSGTTTDAWEWLGPGNIGGRIRSAVIHPEDTDAVWVGSVAGGIWHSENGGEDWSPVDDFMANLAVCAMIIDPNNPDVMYAGTGEGFYNVDGIRGAGVFQSTDTGVTWHQLDSTTSEDWYYVNRLAISPDSATLLAATRTGIFRSTDQGDSWEQVIGDTKFLDVKFDPTDSQKAVASGYSPDLFFTEDGGQTWIRSSGISHSEEGTFIRIELAYAPSDPEIVYASKDYNDGTFYKSEDGGRTFSEISTDYYYLGGQGWYDNVIWVDPTDPNVVIAGGVDLYRSTDAGETFAKISLWYESPVSAHADHHFIIEHPDYNGYSNRIVFFMNDGGIYKTDNVLTVEGTFGWQALNNNLGVTQFYGAAGHPETGIIIGGTQDNGVLSYSGHSEGWVEIYGGDGGYCAFDPEDSRYCYSEYVYLTIERNSLGGKPNESWWEDLITGEYLDPETDEWAWKSAPYVILDAKNWDAEFIAPFILDPNDSNTMLAGGKDLWRTNDVKTPNTVETGPSWASIKPRIGDGYTDNITAIAVAAGDSDIIWAGHGNGVIYRTAGGTSNAPYWRQMGEEILPARRCQRIVIDPENVETIYVTFGGYSADNIYKSTDAGVTWRDISGAGEDALPAAPVRSLVIHPQDSHVIYVGTEVGIFASDDAGETWSTTNEGPTNCSVEELFWLEGATLVAATHGRGLFKINLDFSSQALGLAPQGNTAVRVPEKNKAASRQKTIQKRGKKGNRPSARETKQPNKK